VHEHEDTLVTL